MRFTAGTEEGFSSSPTTGSALKEAAGTWTVACDFLFQYGGAERVVSSLLHDSVGDVSGLVYLAGSREVVGDVAQGTATRRVLPSGVATARNYRHLSPAYPTVLRRVPAIEGNLLVSSYAFAHHLRATGRKVVYCHSPLRQVWSGDLDYLTSVPPRQRPILRAVQAKLRMEDRAAARTADAYIATSSVVKKRIETYYGRSDVEVIPPPIDLDGFAADHLVQPQDRSDYYLLAGRLVEPYKRIGLAIEAFRRLPHLRLIIAGDGRDRCALQAGAPKNVQFVGWQRGKALARLYQEARGIVFPSTDDFGMVPVEAAAASTPTVCFRAGGVLDTVLEGRTGVFFDELCADSLAAAVRRADGNSWHLGDIRTHAQKYSIKAFSSRMRAALERFE